jgi:superfamily II DNA or RNA helicase
MPSPGAAAGRMRQQRRARRRLGLTATFGREDGREGDVFSLIGPKRYDAPWKDIESQGSIAPAECTEVRVTRTPPHIAEAESIAGRASGQPRRDRLSLVLAADLMS